MATLPPPARPLVAPKVPPPKPRGTAARGFGATSRRDPLVAGAGRPGDASSRSARPTCSSAASCSTPLFGTPYEVDGYLSPLFSPLIVLPCPAGLVQPGASSSCGSRSASGRPATTTARPTTASTSPIRPAARSASRRSTGATRWRRRSRSSSRTSTASSCTSRSSRCSSSGSTRPLSLRLDGQWRIGLGDRDPLRQRGAADRLLAVVPLAAPPRRRASSTASRARATRRSATGCGSG